MLSDGVGYYQRCAACQLGVECSGLSKVERLPDGSRRSAKTSDDRRGVPFLTGGMGLSLPLQYLCLVIDAYVGS